MSSSGAKQGELSILLADSHSLFRAGMRYLLAELPYEFTITEARTGAETIEMLRARHFHLIMLECMMPDFMPAPLLTAVRTEAGGTPFIVVSAAEQAESIHAALEAGAAGFVPKSSSPKVMLQAVMLVLSGGTYIPPTVLGHVRQILSADQATQADRPGRLTPRQNTILQYLANGYSNKQIAAALSVSEGTVKSHVAGLLRTLGAKNRTHAIIIASQTGVLQQTH